MESWEVCGSFQGTIWINHLHFSSITFLVMLKLLVWEPNFEKHETRETRIPNRLPQRLPLLHCKYNFIFNNRNFTKKSLKTKNLNIFKVRKITEITNFTILTNPYIFSKVRAQYKKFDMKDYPS